MLEPVTLQPLELEAYADLVPSSDMHAVHAAASGLRGSRILHVSAWAVGDASAHQLSWLVPLTRELGIECEWRVLPRARRAMSAANDDATLQLSIEACGGISDGWDVVVVHGPELALVPRLIPRSAHAWVWRPGAAGHLWSSLVDHFADVVSDVRATNATVIPLGVDPLAPESMPLPARGIARTCSFLGVDPTRPLLLQSSRYGGFDGALDTIDVYWRMKDEQADLQLAIIAGRPREADAPTLDAALARCEEDSDLHVLNGLSDMEVNALRTCARAVLMTGRDLDWRLDAIESFWKARPVLAAERGEDPERLATRTRAIIAATDIAQPVGATGHDMVRTRMLAPMVLSQWLVTLSGVLTRTRRGRPRTASR